MPGDREDEICQKALELLSDLCSKGEVQNENCLDFIYHFRDLARPRYTDSGINAPVNPIQLTGPESSVCMQCVCAFQFELYKDVTFFPVL